MPDRDYAAILRTCRIVYEETSRLQCECNIFELQAEIAERASASQGTQAHNKAHVRHCEVSDF